VKSDIGVIYTGAPHSHLIGLSWPSYVPNVVNSFFQISQKNVLPDARSHGQNVIKMLLLMRQIQFCLGLTAGLGHYTTRRERKRVGLHV